MLCVKLKRKYCVRYLLEDAKVDPNVQSAKQKTTALILACFYGLADVVRVILGAGAIPGLKNKYASGFCELSSAFLVCTWLWSSVLLVLSCS
jgi:ankyrin repeat protein